MRRPWLAVVLLSALPLACGGAAGEPATTYLDDVQARVGAYGTALTTHAERVAAVASLAALGPLEQAHLADATRDLGGVGRDVEGLCACMNDQGDVMGTDAMRAVVDAAVAECARHQASMGSAATLPAARAEEERHQMAMRGALDAMLAARDQMMSGGMTAGGMMGGAGTYGCPMSAP